MEAARILGEKIDSSEIVTGVLATFHFRPGIIEVATKAGLGRVEAGGTGCGGERSRLIRLFTEVAL